MDVNRESLDNEIVDIVQGELSDLGISPCEKHDVRGICNRHALAILNQMEALLQAIYEGVSAPVQDEFNRTYQFKVTAGVISRVMEPREK